MTDYSLERLTPENHSVVNFLIDRDDNLFYLGGNTGYDGENIIYCLTPANKLYKCVANRYWKDAQGNMFIFTREFEDEHHDFILSVDVTETGLKFNYFSKNYDYWLSYLGQVIGNRVYAIHFHYNGEQTKVFDITDKDNITKSLYSGTLSRTHFDGRYVYDLQIGKDFKKFNPVTGVFTEIWKNDPDLEIYGDISLNEANSTISFSAFQLSTRKNILAQIDVNGTFSIAGTLSENNKIVYMEPFN